MLRERLDAETRDLREQRPLPPARHERPPDPPASGRMTDYVETQLRQASRYAEYAQRGKKGYEIEHIWANHPERHTDEFAHPSDFQEYRNRIGGLLLLPKSFNASYGDLPVRREARALPQPEPARAQPPRAGLRPQPRLPAVHRGERPAVPRARGVQEGRPRRAPGALPASSPRRIWNPDRLGAGGRVVSEPLRHLRWTCARGWSRR